MDKEVTDLFGSVNRQKLEERASELNGGKSCIFVPGAYSLMGCANFHAFIDFADGERWLARMPRHIDGLNDTPRSLVEYLVASEFATLKFLENTRVPAPHVYGYGLKSDPLNEVGTDYILMEVMTGETYQSSDMSEADKDKVRGQVADILVELKQHPLLRAGSLIMRDGEIEVGPVASNRFVSLGQYGPFETAAEYMTSIVDQHLDLIADGQLYVEYPEEAFMVYKAAKSWAASLQPDPELSQFYLKHVDDKGDHLMVDAERNVTGVIDWQFARCVPAAEAFGPSILTADLSILDSDVSRLTKDDEYLAAKLAERGELRMSKLATFDESFRRFHWGLASGYNKDEIDMVAQGVLRAIGMLDASYTNRWQDLVLTMCETDARWPKVQQLSREISLSEPN